MTDRLLLIADDLTGCLDTAVQFSRAGVPTFVTTRDAARALHASATVLGADIESRHLRPGEAAGRVERCVQAAARAGIRRFYKKTDSTLRGNVGAELAALLRATGIQELFFVPALPGAGRITRGGVQYVDGLPLHRSRYARDAADPVHEASVAAIIASQADAAVVSVPRGADPAPMLACTRRPAILVFDAETNDDLEAIAGRLAALGPPPLLAGCAGFASVVPGLLGLQRGPTDEPVLRPPLLIVRGMWPLGEVCRGVVVSRLEDAAGAAPTAGMLLVTKAGGFGPIDVIQRIRDALDKEE